jgi:Holliday junction resolvasome RuvABC endonuclease subunit
MSEKRAPARVLAIDPTARGFGFIILEGPRLVVDWGVKSARATSIKREQQLLGRVGDLVCQYRPQVIILEKTDTIGNRRSGRVRLFIAGIENMAVWQEIIVRKTLISQVRRVFLAFGARNKHEIACVVAMHLPEIALRLPRRRKPWMSEDYRMAIFDAAALALTHFYTRGQRRD